MSEIQRRDFLTGAAAVAAATTAILAGAGQAEPGRLQAGDNPPEPIRGNEGATILGPTNPLAQAQSPDRIRPPATDSGTLPTLRWSFTDSHIKMREGGWSRQTTIREIPVLHRPRPGQHAAQGRRGPRAALAQAGRVGLHAQGPGADHRHRRGTAAPSRTTSAKGTCGTSRPASRTRSRAWRATAASSCSSSTTATSAKTARSRSPTGSPIPPARSWPRTSACPRAPSPASPTRSSSSSSRRCPARSPRTGSPAPGRCPCPSATGCWPRSRSAPRAARSASPTRPVSRWRRRSPPRSSKSSPAACASCTGTRTPTRRSTTSPARRG